MPLLKQIHKKSLLQKNKNKTIKNFHVKPQYHVTHFCNKSYGEQKQAVLFVNVGNPQ